MRLPLGALSCFIHERRACLFILLLNSRELLKCNALLNEKDLIILIHIQDKINDHQFELWVPVGIYLSQLCFCHNKFLFVLFSQDGHQMVQDGWHLILLIKKLFQCTLVCPHVMQISSSVKLKTTPSGLARSINIQLSRISETFCNSSLLKEG